MQMSYKSIAVFGDSLSDTGNLHKLTLGRFPAYPYYEGRFCNGPIWVDYLQQHVPNTPFHNYAVGGAGVILDGIPILPYTFSTEELLSKLNLSLEGCLCTVLFGANDYINTKEDISYDVIASIQEQIEDLISRGGRNFLLINIPDLGRTPKGKDNKEFLSRVCLAHNAKLFSLYNHLSICYTLCKFKYFNLCAVLEDIFSSPASYNIQNIISPQLHTVSTETHFFWDEFHPTTQIQKICADRLIRELFT